MPDNWRAQARTIAREEGVPWKLFRALIGAESGGRQNAKSPKGATGRTQLMPETARSLGVDPNDPIDNLRGGARYLAQQLKAQHGDWGKALRAYNAGPGAVEASYEFPETNAYVARILAEAGSGSGSPHPRGGGGGGGGSRSFSLDPVTVNLGADPDVPTKEDAVLSWLKSEHRDPLQLVSDIQAAEQGGGDQTMTIPGVDVDLPRHDGGSGTVPHLPRGGLGELAGEGERLIGRLGFQIGSRSRSAQHNAEVGGAPDSDHLEHGYGSEHVAIDFTGKTPAARKAAAIRLAKRYGIRDWDGEGIAERELKAGRHTYRVQVINGSSVDHGDHGHLGIRRVG